MNENEEEGKIFYQCTVCKAYLDNYIKATIHLGIQHSTVLKDFNRMSNGGVGKCHRNEEDGDLIKPREFSKVIIELEQLKVEAIKKITDELKPQSKLKKTPVRKPRAVSGRLEIKLDSLKVGEMETLINDLFEATSSSANPNPEANPIRRSSRKVKESAKVSQRNYGELDSEDEEIMKGGVVTSRSNSPDFRDYDVSTDTEDEDVKYDPKRGKPLKPRSKVKRKTGDIGYDRKRKPRNRQNRTYLCKICQMRLSERAEYYDHMKRDHLTDDQYFCPHCQEGLPSLAQFERHVIDVHGNANGSKKTSTPADEMKCKICGKTFQYLALFTSHMEFHERAIAEDPNRPYVCPICKHRFCRNENLRKHFLKHLDNNPFKCKFDGCGKTFNSDHNVRRHERLHTNRVVYNCEGCPAKYATMQRLIAHIARYHSENSTEKPAMRVRPRLFYVKTSKESDTQIVQTNTDNFTDAPNPPSKSSSSMIPSLPPNTPDVEENERLASDETRQPKASKPQIPIDLDEVIRSDPVVKKLQKDNPTILAALPTITFQYNRNNTQSDFKCQICPWTGSRAYMFQEHMKKIHGQGLAPPSELNSKTFPLAMNRTCLQCGYQSTSPEDLSAHVSKAHIGKLKFRCKHCGIRFPTKTRLDLHERQVHLSSHERFKCTECEAHYFTRRSLASHMKHKHDPEFIKMLETLYKCDTCGKVLANKASFACHMNLHSNKRKKKLSTCKICGQTCATPNSLSRHIQYVHMGVQNPYNPRLRKQRKVRQTKIMKSQDERPETSDSDDKDDDDVPEPNGTSINEVHDADEIKIESMDPLM